MRKDRKKIKDQKNNDANMGKLDKKKEELVSNEKNIKISKKRLRFFTYSHLKRHDRNCQKSKEARHHLLRKKRDTTKNNQKQKRHDKK